MKVKPIKQRDASACGPTCIEMALRYFDIPHTIAEVAKVTNYKKEGGIYNDRLVTTLQSFGLKTKVYRNSTWETLQKFNTLDVLVVVSWMLDGYISHLSVVEKTDAKNIYLAEPSTGKVAKVEKIKFLRLWMDYEALAEVPWYPEKRSNIQLRWMVVVTK